MQRLLYITIFCVLCYNIAIVFSNFTLELAGQNRLMPDKNDLIMQRIVIDIPDNKISFFMELVKNLGFKKVRRLTNEQREFVDDLKQSLGQVDDHQKGKIKLQSARDFVNEL